MCYIEVIYYDYINKKLKYIYYIVILLTILDQEKIVLYYYKKYHG